jgi:hypothetical protein
MFTPLEIMPHCSAAGLDFRIIPTGFNTPLEFLTGFIQIKSKCCASYFLRLRRIFLALTKVKMEGLICFDISGGFKFCGLKNLHHLTSENNKNLIVFENFGGNKEIKKGKVCRGFLESVKISI